MAGYVTGDFRARRQHPLQRLWYAHLQPTAGGRVEGIGNDREQFATTARQQAVTPRRLGGGQQIEGGFEPGQLGTRKHPVVERASQGRGEFHRAQTRVFLKEIERWPAAGLRCSDRGTQQRFVQTKHARAVDRRAH